MQYERSGVKNILWKHVTFHPLPAACLDMGLVITPLQTPRRFHPLAQLEASPQQWGGRELVWRFDGGDITSDGGVLALQKLEQRTGIVRRFAACFIDYRKADQVEHLCWTSLRNASLAWRWAMRISTTTTNCDAIRCWLWR